MELISLSFNSKFFLFHNKSDQQLELYELMCEHNAKKANDSQNTNQL